MEDSEIDHYLDTLARELFHVWADPRNFVDEVCNFDSGEANKTMRDMEIRTSMQLLDLQNGIDRMDEAINRWEDKSLLGLRDVRTLVKDLETKHALQIQKITKELTDEVNMLRSIIVAEKENFEEQRQVWADREAQYLKNLEDIRTMVYGVTHGDMLGSF